MDLSVTVIGGYLGAGKTTLVNHLLRQAGGRRLAVLVNEFGALSIDEDLIEAREDGLLSISGGCVCCAYGSDMIGALEDIRDAEPGFDHVLLEASGVALPGSIMTSVGLVEGLRAEAALVLADAEQIRRNARNKFLADTVERQLVQADLLLMTKRDLVTNSEAEAVTHWLRERAPQASILSVSQGEIALELVLGIGKSEGRLNETETPPHACFKSLVIAQNEVVNAEKLVQRLAESEAITRAKGFVETSDGFALIHVVGGRGSVEHQKGPCQRGVVCIGVGESFAETVRDVLA